MSERKMVLRRVIVALAVAITVVVLAAVVQSVLWLNQKGHAETTVTRMARLETFLVAFQPADTTVTSLAELAKREHYGLDFRDGWGHEFAVSAASGPNGRYIYTVRSFGRDGQPGPCCSGFLRGQWDQDAVLSNGRWLQAW